MTRSTVAKLRCATATSDAYSIDASLEYASQLAVPGASAAALSCDAVKPGSPDVRGYAENDAREVYNTGSEGSMGRVKRRTRTKFIIPEGPLYWIGEYS